MHCSYLHGENKTNLCWHNLLFSSESCDQDLSDEESSKSTWNANKLISFPKYKIKILLFSWCYLWDNCETNTDYPLMNVFFLYSTSWAPHGRLWISPCICAIHSLTYLMISKVMATYSSPSSPLLRTQVLFINLERQ